MILGVDPGLASTGYALLDRRAGRLVAVAHGTLRTSPRTEHPQRLRALHDGIATLLAEHVVDGAALESWFVHPVSRAAMGMAEARGAILVALAGAGCPVREYPPTEIKKAVTGTGAAGKDQVRAMVGRLCGVAPSSDHVADALAAAICDLHRAPLRAAIRDAG